MDLASKLAQFETGSLDEEKALELFQYLVDTGIAWQLQGSYGRMAMGLIEKGLVHATN